MVEETPGVAGGAAVGSTGGAQLFKSVRSHQSLDGESIEEQAQTSIAQFAAASRRVTMVFDPALAADAARTVRGGGTLASFVEAMHQREDAEGTVDPESALAVDGYDYKASATAQEVEVEIAAWHDLLHGRNE